MHAKTHTCACTMYHACILKQRRDRPLWNALFSRRTIQVQVHVHVHVRRDVYRSIAAGLLLRKTSITDTSYRRIKAWLPPPSLSFSLSVSPHPSLSLLSWDYTSLFTSASGLPGLPHMTIFTSNRISRSWLLLSPCFHGDSTTDASRSMHVPNPHILISYNESGMYYNHRGFFLSFLIFIFGALSLFLSPWTPPNHHLTSFLGNWPAKDKTMNHHTITHTHTHT
jgi:hypothetical protein